MEKTCCPDDKRKIDFCRVIEKRIRKFVRLNEIFKKNDVILVKDDVSLYFIKRIIRDLPVKIVKSGKADKIIGVWTADDEINNFFLGVIGKRKELSGKFVKMFVSVTDDELEKYCKGKVKFVRNKKDPSVQGFVDEISLKFPDSKHKLIKSLERLRSL